MSAAANPVLQLNFYAQFAKLIQLLISKHIGLKLLAPLHLGDRKHPAREIGKDFFTLKFEIF